MIPDRVLIAFEVVGLRTRGYLHLAIQAAGIALVLLAIHNAIGWALLGTEPLAPYRPPVTALLSNAPAAASLADLVVLGVGLVLAYWG